MAWAVAVDIRKGRVAGCPWEEQKTASSAPATVSGLKERKKHVMKRPFQKNQLYRDQGKHLPKPESLECVLNSGAQQRGTIT